jgi:CBS domain-containing protein
MLGPTVRDWMRLGVVTCAPETSADAVAATMTVHDVSALVVTDADGFAVGLVSRTDLVSATFAGPDPARWRGLTARQLMSSPVISVRADSPVAEAVRWIRDRQVHRVVVTVAEGGRERPIGILSVTDLIEGLCAARSGPAGRAL